jgi:glucokinase
MLNLILAGDIGGTKINLACFTLEQGLTHPLTEATYPTADFADFESILSDFLGPRAGEVAAATFGVAGPVEGERVELVNVPWVLDCALLRRHLLTERIGLINDMMAMAYGAMALPEESFAVLNAGEAGVRVSPASAGRGMADTIKASASARRIGRPERKRRLTLYLLGDGGVDRALSMVLTESMVLSGAAGASGADRGGTRRGRES